MWYCQCTAGSSVLLGCGLVFANGSSATLVTNTSEVASAPNPSHQARTMQGYYCSGASFWADIDTNNCGTVTVFKYERGLSEFHYTVGLISIKKIRSTGGTCDRVKAGCAHLPSVAISHVVIMSTGIPSKVKCKASTRCVRFHRACLACCS